MSVRDTRRAEALERMADHLLAEGLAGASLRPLAKAAGVSDRMLLYYFDDKEEALGLALMTVADRLTSALSAVTPEPAPPDRLAGQLWPILRSPEMRPAMALWLEISAAAARGQAPFVAVAARIAADFLAWLDAHLVAPEADRAALGALVLGALDGLVIIDAVGQGALADRAAEAWGRLSDLPSHD